MFPKIVNAANIARSLRKGARAVLHSGEVVAVKAGQWIDPATVAAVLVSPESAVPLALGRLGKIRRNPTGTGAHAVGEKGSWVLVKPEKREEVGGLLAWGPAGTLEDAEGRLYSFRWALVPMAAILTSHTATGRKTEGYPQELQGRDRGAAASLAQVRALAASLDPRRILLASSTPADSAPVVVYLPDREAYAVASGNGRAMAARAAFEESEAWEQYLSAVAARWNIAAKLDELDRSARFLAVRVLGGKQGASMEQARALAGASQGTASAELTELERAAHLGRSLGIETPIAIGGIDWEKPIAQNEISEFASSNPKFWQGLTGKLDASKRAALKASPEASAKLVLSAMLQGLPAGVLAQVYAPDGKPDLVEALVGMLPAYWTIQTDAEAGRIRPGWALAPVLSLSLDWYRRLGGKGVAAMRAALEGESGQRSLDLEPSHDGPTMSDPLAYALGVAFVKASARTDPAAAMASYLSPYLKQARQDDPAAVSMFGDSEGPDPARVLLGAVDRRLLGRAPVRSSPPRGRVRQSRGGTEVVYPGGVRVHFPRRLEEADALRAADAHYLEAYEGQGSLFPGMGRESTIRNPSESVPWLRGPRAMWDGIAWAAESAGVSATARGPRGFFPAWRRAGYDPRRLPEEWRAKRAAFAARHLAQYLAHPTERRALALMVWAVDVDRIDKRRKKTLET
jgi:hypothetical protein